MKLFSLLPRRLVHFACNSPPDSRPQNPLPPMRLVAGCAVFLGFPRCGKYFSTAWKTLPEHEPRFPAPRMRWKTKDFPRLAGVADR